MKRTHSLTPLGLFVALAVNFFAISLQAETYHVAVNGNDEHQGTSANPFKTISRSAQLAQPGDTIIVHEGIYRERVAPPRGGSLGKPIVYMAAPGERVVIKGSEIWNPNWTKGGSGAYYAIPDPALFNDLKSEYVDSHNPLEVELASTPWQREGRREKERGYQGDDSIVFTCGQVFVDGKRLREVPLKKELQAGCWHYESDSKRVYVHFGDTKPSTHSVELTTRRRIFAPAKRGLDYITVQGFIMEHCGNQYPTNFWETDANAQKGALGTEAGSHWIIRRNLIRHAKTFAIDAGYVDKRSRRILPENNLIEENYIVDNGSAGILSNSSRGMIIRGNVILRNNVLRFFELKRWEQAGIKCHNFKDGLIEGNYVADNILTYGVWLDNKFPDSRVSRNVLVNNGRAGLFLEMSDYDFDRLLVDNNVIVGNRQNPVYIHDASGATFVHNLLAGTEPSDEYGQAVFIRQVSARTKTYHHSFYNNMMLSNSLAVESNYPSHRSGPQRFDYNFYGVDANANAFHINPASEKPSPWSADEFLSVVSTDLGESRLPPQGRRGLVRLNFEQWRSFWRAHDLENGVHSTLSPGSSASYRPEDQSITLVIDTEPSSLATKPIAKVKSDLFHQSFEDCEQVFPGPFQNLRQGSNTFQVWDGLPLLAQAQLPPRGWNKASATAEESELSKDFSLTSPNGEIRLQFTLEDTDSVNAAPTYQIWYSDKPIIAKSTLGFELADNTLLSGDFQVVSSQATSNDSNWKPVCGERSVVRDYYRQLEVQLRQRTGARHEIQLTFRCYDEGAAFRYRIESGAAESLTLKQEHSQFCFMADHTAWLTTSAQGKHEPTPLSKLPNEVERPLVIRTEDDLYVAVAEAAMHNYARMRLQSLEGKAHSLTCKLAGPVSGNLPITTPWRVVMIADSPGELVENNDIIRNLNEPCALKDTSWIKAGKVIRDITLTTDGGLACVDFAVKHNLQYVEFDAGWYGNEYDDASDATTITVDPKRSKGPLDLQKVTQYAEERGIGIILYVNRRALERQLDELLPLFKSWGIKGIKFGFVRVGSQEWTNWLHDSIRKAADYGFMVDVHDEYRSTGYERTYPNLMTVEGIGGDETSPSNLHALRNLFTRMISGPADHKICYFDERVDRDSSHACQLAKAMCFFDPWQFLFWYDSPSKAFAKSRKTNVIHETPELEFWEYMPTIWDDTRVLHGNIDEFAVIARRSGDAWFVGAINNEDARVLDTPLTFLEPNQEYIAHRYYDDPEVDTITQVGIRQQQVSQNSTLSIRMQSNGGEAIRIVPKD